MNINRIKKNIKKVEEIVENIDAQDIINRMEIDKENSIEELKQELEELYRTQQARLDTGADDLDIREEIAEVEEEIKELQDETIEENSIKNERSSIEEDIKIIEDFILKTDVDYSEYNEQIVGDISYQAIQHLLSAYQEVLKENEKLKNDNKYLRERETYLEKRREDIINFFQNQQTATTIPIQKIKNIIDRIDYDIEKTKEIISKNTNINASYRKNDYQIVRLRAMNTKSLDIKKRLQELLESEE